MAFLRKICSSRLLNSRNKFQIDRHRNVIKRFLSEEADRHSFSGEDIVLTFSSPSQVFYNLSTAVTQLDVPTIEGSFGILPKHVPTIAVMTPGVVNIVESSGNSIKYFVSSGSITVNEDSSVQILAEEACKLDQLDAEETKTTLGQLQQSIANTTDEKAKVEAEIGVGVCEAILEALHQSK